MLSDILSFSFKLTRLQTALYIYMSKERLTEYGVPFTFNLKISFLLSKSTKRAAIRANKNSLRYATFLSVLSLIFLFFL